MNRKMFSSFKRVSVVLGLLFCGALACVAEEASQKVTEAIDDWAKITYPAEVAPDVPFEVDVEILKIDAPTKLGVNLSYTKQNGKYGGLLKWGGAARDITSPGKTTWPFKFVAKPELADAMVLVYLSPDGEWGSNTKNATGKKIKVKLGK